MKKVMDKDRTLFIITGCLVGATLCSSGLLSASNVSADDTTTHQVSVTVPISCSLATYSGSGTYSASIANGTSGEITGSTFKATCNDNGGYAIYAIGFSGDSYTDATHTTMIGSPSTIGNIATGTATSGATSNWGMWLTTESGGTYPITIANGTSGTENFTANHVVPSTYTKVAYRDSATDIGANATGSLLTTHYKAYMSESQPAGTYTGQVKYTLVHPATETPLMPVDCPSGYICYNPNGGNVVGTMGRQSVSDSATSATLLAGNYSRDGYGFAGWSDAYDYATNNNANFYGPQEDITFTVGQYAGTNDGLALYAVWVKSVGSIQDAGKVATLCGTGTGSLTADPADGTANLGSVSALTDQRDNETYAIAKLADGNCWMIENLRLENTAAHNSDGALAQGYGTSSAYGDFNGLADPEYDNFWSVVTANSLYYSGTQSGTASINIGTTNGPGYRMPRYNNTNISTPASNPTTNGDDVAFYSYGNYYTWHAAIADTAFYDPNSGFHERDTTSICPSGWRLPKGSQSTDSKSFGALSVALGGPANGAISNNSSNPTGTVMSKRFRSYPNNFLYSGYFDYSDATYRGSYGFYWSSTQSASDGAYRLRVASTYVYPGTGYSTQSKFLGSSIRCVIGS